jgi:hypothetical protein
MTADDEDTIELTTDEYKVIIELAEWGWEAHGLIPGRHAVAESALAKLKALRDGDA